MGDGHYRAPVRGPLLKRNHMCASMSSRKLLVALAAIGLLTTACGGDGADITGEAAERPDIVVSSFNFPESEILAEVYGQAMEAAGYPVEYSLQLGARDLIYDQGLLVGDVDFVPEYVGSALMTWFEAEAPTDVESGVEALSEALATEEVTVLEPAPAQNSNAFVVRADWAEENDVATIGDLANVGEITFAGPPECEERQTCYGGLQALYDLGDVDFASVQEASARLAGLESGQYEMILLFSTDAPLASDDLVALEDTEGIIPPENIVPVVRDVIIEAYGDELASTVNEVSAAITTEELQQMNAKASEGIAASEIAATFVEENELA